MWFRLCFHAQRQPQPIIDFRRYRQYLPLQQRTRRMHSSLRSELVQPEMMVEVVWVMLLNDVHDSLVSVSHDTADADDCYYHYYWRSYCRSSNCYHRRLDGISVILTRSNNQVQGKSSRY
jgi:hypothetical protein